MSKPRKNKLRRQRKERDAQADAVKQLLAYLEDYDAGEGIQDPSQAAVDSQIKGLALPLANAIAATDQGTIIDVGCGRGILLHRLNDISAFKDKKGWSYYGTDYDEHKDEIIAFAYEAGIHRRVDFVPLEIFYKNWPEGEDTKRPHVAIIRNVMHELNIEDTTRLLHHLTANLTQGDTLYIQDLQVFPKAERGNVCWQLKHLVACLIDAGFAASSVEEPSRSGNRWFSIEATRTDAPSPTLDQLSATVIAQRTRQWQGWKELGALHEEDKRFRDVIMAKIDFDLQFGSLSIQLQEVRAAGVAKFTETQEVLLLREAFYKQLTAFDLEAFSAQKININTLSYFRDRANNQDSLEKFLRESSTVAVIFGGPVTGKSALVKEVLSRRAIKRNALFLDIPANSSVWNIINELLSKLGSHVSDDIAKGFRDIRFADISDQLRKFIFRVAPRTIFVIENFERLVNPNGVIADPEVREFVKFLAQAPGAKLIITSQQYDIDFSFIDTGLMTKVKQPPIGRFPRGDHVVNVLDDFVDRAQHDFEDYPKELLEAIDRHPFLTHLAALIIQREGKGCLLNVKLLEQLKGNLRSQLIERVVDNTTRAAVEVMSLLRIPVPQSLIEALAGKESVGAAAKAGLVYSVGDRSRTDLISVIGVLRFRAPEGEFGKEPTEDGPTALDEMHRSIATEYGHLYRQDDNPRWLRELHYHTLLVGDPSEISRFGTKYKTEIFWAGDYLFKVRKYEAALWAFKTARDLSLKTHHTEMRLAACLMRTGKRAKGEKLYQKMIENYPQVWGIKTSFIDSVLYLRDFRMALDRLQEYEFEPTENHWIAGQFGRAHFGLHEYSKAIEAFEIQFKLLRKPIVYRSLARAYRSIGKTERQFSILKRGITEFPDRDDLIRDYAACLERQGGADKLLEAERMLLQLYEKTPQNGLVLLPYCKVLCRLNKVDVAEHSFWQARGHIYPDNFELPIEIEILKSQEKWDQALRLLRDVALSDEHMLGVKMEVYFSWAMSELNGEERERIARDGLGVPISTELLTNAPLMITGAKLAVAAKDFERFEEFVRRVKVINPDSEDLSRILEEAHQQYAWDVA